MSTTKRSTDPDASFTSLGPDARSYERYAEVTLEDDAILLYDREEEDAWITAEEPVDLTDAA